MTGFVPKIDPELRDLIDPLTDNEYSLLEKSILAEGLREPLITWSGFLIDGHHRLKICQAHDVEFKTREMFFPDKRAVRIWMHSNQLGRRNLAQFAKNLHALAIEDELAADAKERQKRKPKTESVVDNCPQHKPERTRDKLAEMAGTSTRTIRQTKAIVEAEPEPEIVDVLRSGDMSINSGVEAAKLEPEEQREVAAEVATGKPASKAIKEVKAKSKKNAREEKIKEIEQNLITHAPDGEYDVIVIDPPWPYDDGKPAESYDPSGRRASNPYPEMSMSQIAAIDLPSAPDCVLWLWTTHKFLRDSFALLDGWGFQDKAVLTWVKDRMGLGSWLRSQSEFCIMAVKGSPPVRLTNQTTVINGPLREHSRKPDEFYDMVDQLCVGRKIDWFSRETREGWQQFGNDTEKFDGV